LTSLKLLQSGDKPFVLKSRKKLPSSPLGRIMSYVQPGVFVAMYNSKTHHTRLTYNGFSHGASMAKTLPMPRTRNSNAASNSLKGTA